MFFGHTFLSFSFVRFSSPVYFKIRRLLYRLYVVDLFTTFAKKKNSTLVAKGMQILHMCDFYVRAVARRRKSNVEGRGGEGSSKLESQINARVQKLISYSSKLSCSVIRVQVLVFGIFALRYFLSLVHIRLIREYMLFLYSTKSPRLKCNFILVAFSTLVLVFPVLCGESGERERADPSKSRRHSARLRLLENIVVGNASRLVVFLKGLYKQFGKIIGHRGNTAHSSHFIIQFNSDFYCKPFPPSPLPVSLPNLLHVTCNKISPLKLLVEYSHFTEKIPLSFFVVFLDLYKLKRSPLPPCRKIPLYT